MKKMILLFLLLLGTEPLPAQVSNDYSSYRFTESHFFYKHTPKLLSPPKYSYYSPYGYTTSNFGQNIFNKNQSNFYRLYSLKDFNASTDTKSKTSFWVELGYVMAMETVFTGMSYLASREKSYGRTIAGGFDLFMGFAGISNASHQKLQIQKTGHYLIAAGFIAKSLYNFHFGKKHKTNTKFYTNFISFNVLVFTGYYLDTLK